MANYQYMMSAEDVAKELNCSKFHAYKFIKSMNNELDSEEYRFKYLYMMKILLYSIWAPGQSVCLQMKGYMKNKSQYP